VKSQNVHRTRETPLADTPEGKAMIMAEYERLQNGEISEQEYLEFLKSRSGSVLTESDQENFRNQNNDDKRDSDGTGAGSTMYIAVEGNIKHELWDDMTDATNKIALMAHERVHQYNSDRGKIDNLPKNGVPREENRASRIAYRIVRQINRNTKMNIEVNKRYKQ
jgi:hypothetical protein